MKKIFTRYSQALAALACCAALASTANGQPIIESFDDFATIPAGGGVGSSWASGAIEGGPFQWTQQDGYIHFQPWNGGNPTHNGSIAVPLDSALDLSAYNTLSFTARRNAGSSDGPLLLQLYSDATQIVFVADGLAFAMDDFTTVTFAFSAGAYEGGSFNFGNVTGWSISAYGSNVGDFRMDFADLSAVEMAAVPEPASLALFLGIIAGGSAIWCRRRLSR